ncbi:hypothetical protein G6F70_004664 [Rhizopus microsporus]|nr:hypothetical protein G6F71_004723 [Rhizopus microsporus]KAG1199731.1 hypothetical protein G6F70_004664 [Rhizopus microsporus]KAG1211465.1 hypothetical protein G6F69_004573 [Rhizopus microsporus]KAG1233390.1 hypothetical protein G6F67_004311 [Rhizopus microsporus]KAG1265397.1 hypothetical protein G6F68_003612 [Rhizopus microsporus]
MSVDNIPYILQRKCKDRDGIRITKEYLQSFWSQGQRRPTPDTEEAYNQLVQDFLNKDIALTSEPVIPENFGQNSIETFPQGHLRHGGGVVLQIQDTIDIRYSTLSLLNNLTNATPVRQIYVERNKDDEVDFQRGMLRWTLSDGKNQIQAMEMETIPELSLTTPFGCKILIKSCQVRRGMLLLRRNNVKVMGGAVPELYGGDMLKELENRLKASLGLLENPPQQAPPPPSSLTQRNATLPPPLPSDMDDDVLMDDEFFDDDIDYAELERMEADPIEQFDSTIDDMSLDKDDGFFDDLDQLSLNNNNLSRSVPSNSEFDYDEITLAEENIVSSIQQDTAQPSSSARTINNTSSISLSKKTHATLDDSHPPKKRINLGKKTETASSMTLSKHTVDLTVDDDEEFHPEQSTQAELESVSWIDESVWNDLNEATKESNNGNEGIFVDDQGKTHITFAKLQETLKLMESDNYSSHLPDVVIVRAKCVQFGKLVTSNRLYSLVLYFDDPDQQTGHPVQVVFSNDALTKLLNARRQDVVNVNASGGQKAVLRQIFKPFDKKVRNAIADIEIDLSITQKSNDANTGTSLMPMGIGYTGVSRSLQKYHASVNFYAKSKTETVSNYSPTLIYYPRSIGLLSTGLFSGMTAAVSTISVPSIKASKDPLPTFVTTYKQGAKFAITTILTATVSNGYCYYKTKDNKYLYAALLAFFSGPWTAFVIAPVNNQLFALQKDDSYNINQVNQLVDKWAVLHSVRAIAGAAAFLVSVMM